jgi:hypothetical protein
VGLTQSSRSDRSSSSSSFFCFSTAAGSYVKSRTVNLVVEVKVSLMKRKK